MTPDTFVEIVRNFGPLVAVMVYFVWRDYVTAQIAIRREQALSVRLSTIEDWQRSELKVLATECTKVIAENSSALRSFVDAVHTRPCLAPGKDH